MIHRLLRKLNLFHRSQLIRILAQRLADLQRMADESELSDAPGMSASYLDQASSVLSETKFNEALELLALEGYNVYGIGVPQVTNIGKQTNVKVLAKPNIEQRDIYADFGKIQSVSDDYFTRDDGQTYSKLEYPASVDSKRIQICYGDQGGLAKDGVIELRRGVDDLNLGKSHYAQVRILVDGTHYLKGMAMYADDLPDGVDIRFNTNKPSGTPPEKVMKGIKNDPLNPFGALIKPKGQSHYIDADGNERLSAINKLKEEGDWDVMAKNLSSQFLSKQLRDLIRKQLNLAYQNSEYQRLLYLLRRA